MNKIEAIMTIVNDSNKLKTSTAQIKRFRRAAKVLGLSETEIIELGKKLEVWGKTDLTVVV